MNPQVFRITYMVGRAIKFGVEIFIRYRRIKMVHELGRMLKELIIENFPSRGQALKLALTPAAYIYSDSRYYYQQDGRGGWLLLTDQGWNPARLVQQPALIAVGYNGSDGNYYVQDSEGIYLVEQEV